MIIIADLHLTPAIPEKTRLFRNTGVNDFVTSLNNEFLEIK